MLFNNIIMLVANGKHERTHITKHNFKVVFAKLQIRPRSFEIRPLLALYITWVILQDCLISNINMYALYYMYL